MNQSFVAGLGNIYCSEILFDAQINPKKFVKILTISRLRHIISSTRKILNKAIKLGGTTIKNFIVSDEKIGYFKNELKVYGKENFDCIRCLKLGKIKKIIQNGRSTFIVRIVRNKMKFLLVFKFLVIFLQLQKILFMDLMIYQFLKK